METQILKRSFFCSYEKAAIYMKGLTQYLFFSGIKSPVLIFAHLESTPWGAEKDNKYCYLVLNANEASFTSLVH